MIDLFKYRLPSFRPKFFVNPELNPTTVNMYLEPQLNIYRKNFMLEAQEGDVICSKCNLMFSKKKNQLRNP